MMPPLAAALLALTPAPQEVEALFLPLVTERFELHSNAAVNQHHFLYRWAETEARTDRRAPTRPVSAAERAVLATLVAEERAAWERAVAHYREHVIARDLLFDEGLVSVKRAFAFGQDWESDEHLPTAGERALLASFEAAREMYLAHWWPAHDRANRTWIRAVRPLLEAHEVELSEQVVTALGGNWPGRVHVDVAAYANWAGAYTSENPVHVTITSGDPELGGWSSLEMLMHEPCHSMAIERPLNTTLEAAFAAHGGRPPRELWHATIFFTTGELTRRFAVEHGATDYVPVGDRIKVYDRAWGRSREALGKHWIHWLEGRATQGEVLAEMATDLAGGQ
jgi:hypothetical protein